MSVLTVRAVELVRHNAVRPVLVAPLRHRHIERSLLDHVIEAEHLIGHAAHAQHLVQLFLFQVRAAVKVIHVVDVIVLSIKHEHK